MREKERDYTDRDVIEKVSHAKISSSSSPRNGCHRSDCGIKRFGSISDTYAAKRGSRSPRISPRSCCERSIWSQFPFPSVSRRLRPTIAFFFLSSWRTHRWKRNLMHTQSDRTSRGPATRRFSGRCRLFKQLFRFAVACYMFVES